MIRSRSRSCSCSHLHSLTLLFAYLGVVPSSANHRGAKAGKASKGAKVGKNGRASAPSRFGRPSGLPATPEEARELSRSNRFSVPRALSADSPAWGGTVSADGDRVSFAKEEVVVDGDKIGTAMDPAPNGTIMAEDLREGNATVGPANVTESANATDETSTSNSDIEEPNSLNNTEIHNQSVPAGSTKFGVDDMYDRDVGVGGDYVGVGGDAPGDGSILMAALVAGAIIIIVALIVIRHRARVDDDGSDRTAEPVTPLVDRSVFVPEYGALKCDTDRKNGYLEVGDDRSDPLSDLDWNATTRALLAAGSSP